jgi:hypothetical protein
MKASELLEQIKGTNFEVRIYRDLEMIITASSKDCRDEKSEFASLLGAGGNWEDYIDENHESDFDYCGEEYVIWNNEDFKQPIIESEIDERIEYYKQYGN